MKAFLIWPVVIPIWPDVGVIGGLTAEMNVHKWAVTPQEAIAIQKELSGKVIKQDNFDVIRRVAGVDVGFEQGGKITRAAIVVLTFPSLELVDRSISRLPTQFPYIPGLLSFRELPAVLNALKTLNEKPDIFLCDGQGIAHPRRFGIACHLGVLIDRPTIGVGKTRLTGKHDAVPDKRGAWCPLHDRGEVIGAVLRTREGVKPIYVSTGHRVSLETAIDIVMRCTTRYKLPETTRMAHNLASHHK